MDDYDNVSVSVPVEMLLMIWGKEREPVETTGCEVCDSRFRRWQEYDLYTKTLNGHTDWKPIDNHRNLLFLLMQEHFRKCPNIGMEKEDMTESLPRLKGRWQMHNKRSKHGRCWLCREEGREVVANNLCNRCYQAAQKLMPQQPVA